MTVSVPVVRLPHAEGLPLPCYMTAGAVGMDLLAAIHEEVVLPPMGRCLVPSGIAIAVPEGFEAQVRPRSGLALRHGVTVLNSPGTIDADYRGEIGIILINLGATPFVLQRGERIAQLLLAAVARISWHETTSLPKSGRGAAGFGHTGSS
ncbi:MAG: dUTP diphosphatase [Magnetococcales bacterium]|nr:dUTP diphosphatase [Magnetococcales bacterium]